MSRRIDIIVSANTGNLGPAMTQATNTVKSATSAFQGLQPALQNTITNMNNASTRSGALSTSFGSLRTQTANTGGTLKKIGEFVGGNKGLVFGFAGLSSAMGEAVGMLGMYDDTAKLVAEDQAVLNKLEAEGITSGKEYADAEQEKAKHMRFFNMVQRNTMLSMMDNIFFTTMAINGMIKFTTENNRGANILNKLRGIFKASAVEQAVYSTTLTAMGTSANAAATSSVRLTAGVAPLTAMLPATAAGAHAAAGGFTAMARAALAAAAPILALVTAIALATAGVVSVQQMTESLKKDNPERFHGDNTPFGKDSLWGRFFSGEKIPGEPTDEPLKGVDKAFENSFLGKIMKGTGLSDISKGIQEMLNPLMPAQTQPAEQSLQSLQEIWVDWEEALVKAYPEFQKQIPTFLQMVNAEGMVSDATKDMMNTWAEAGTSEANIAARKVLVNKAIEEAIKLTGDEEGAMKEVQKIEANRIATMENQLKIDTERAELEAEIGKQMGQRAIEIAEVTAAENSYAEATGQRVNMATLDWEMAQKVIAVHEEVKNKYKEEELALMALAEENGIMISGLHEKTQNEIDDTEAMKQQIVAQLDWGKSLTDATEKQKMITEGQLQGTLALQEYTNNLVIGGASSHVFRSGLEMIVNKTYPFIDTTHMMTEELQNLIQLGFIPAEERMEMFRRQAEESTDAVKGFFGNIIGAEDKKSFNKAFKELDLGMIPKKVRDDVKEMFKDLRKTEEKTQETAIAFNAAALAVSDFGKASGEVSASEVDKIMGKVVDELDKLAATDFELGQLQQVPGLFNDIKNNADKIPDTMAAFAEAFQDGNISVDELNKVQAIYLNETGKISDAELNRRLGIQGINEDTSAQSEEMKKLTEKMVLLTAEVVLTEEAYSAMMEMNSTMTSTMIENATTYSEHFIDTMGINMEAGSTAADDIVDTFAEMQGELAQQLEDLTSVWEDETAKWVDAAEQAASDIKSELAAIPDEEVKVNFVKTGFGQATGGVYSFADGGVVSAAGGLTTSNGETHFMYGDNPGGRETLAFIPHNEPARSNILDRLDAMFGRNKEMNVINASGGERDIVINLTINSPDGQESYQRRYRAKQGQEVASLVGSG